MGVAIVYNFEIQRLLSALIVGLAAVLPWAPVATAQQQPTFRTRTDLVQVDVVVLDKAGRPVHGLTAADFTVLDRKTPQTIATFQEVQHDIEGEAAADPLESLPATVPLDVADNQSARTDRLVVMVLDDLHTWVGRTDRVKAIARQTVNEIGQHASMAIILTGGDRGAEVTSDRSELLAAIDRFKGRQSTRRPILGSDDRKSSDPLVGSGPQEFDQNMRTIQALEQAAKIIATNDGRRKAFVFVSEWMAKDLSGIFGLGVAPGEAPQGGEQYAMGGDAEATMHMPPESFITDALLESMEAMRRSNVATYSIDPRGYVSPQDVMKECFPLQGYADQDPCVGVPGSPPDWSSWLRQAQHGLERVSEASGGFAIVNTDDFGTGIHRILTDLDNYYMLGFYPDDTKTKGWRKLDVRVDRPNVTIRHRGGYDIAGPADTAKKNSDPLVKLEAGAVPETALPMRLSAVALPGPLAKSQVVVALEVRADRRVLADPDHDLRDSVKYSILAANPEKGKVVAHLEREAHVVLKPTELAATAPEEIAYTIETSLDLSPGHYQLRASATSARMDKGGSVYLDIDVPDYHKEPIVVGDVAIARQSGIRVPVAESTVAKGLLPILPALDRVFMAADTLLVAAPVGGKERATSATIQVLDTGGTTATSGVARVVTTSRQVRIGRLLTPISSQQIEAVLPLTGLPPGPYRLRITAIGEKSQAVHELGIVIR